MIQQQIDLKKKRDFSDVLNASFTFIKQEYKLLWKVLFLYAGIPVLINAILGSLFTEVTIADSIKVIMDPGSAQTINTGFQGQTFIFSIISLIVNVFLVGLTYCYIVLYVERGAGNITTSEVWNKFVGLFAALLGYNILTGIVLILAFIALIIPGIYVMVPLSFVLIIKVAENKGFSETFERCFYLVKSHWWETLGLLLIASIIVIIISSIFSIPASSYAMAKGLLSEKPTLESIPFVITSFVSTIGTAIITPLTAIVLSFQYYSLVEHKDNTSLLDRINRINENPED